MDHWWNKQPLTISAIQIKASRGSKAAFDEYVSKSGYNVEQLYHLLASAEADDMIFYDEAKHGAMLDDYLKYTERSGIKTIVYTNTHCLSGAKASENQAYWQLDKEGKPLFGYGIFHISCVNPNGPFHQEVIRNVKGLCSHDIGGIFFDGPLMLDRGCYCETCKTDFLKKYGHSIYEANARELREFRVNTVTEHIRLAHETIKSINPEIALYINNSALRPDITGSNTRKVYDYVDLLGAEAGFYVPSLTCESLWQTPAFMKHLECIIGDPVKERKPFVNFIAGNESGVSGHHKTAGETVLTYAQTLANGGNIWFGFHYDVFESMDTPSAVRSAEYNHFILDHKELYRASKCCARVALMWSENTANNYASSVEASDFTEARSAGYKQRGDHRKALFAFVDMLERSHVQFDIVDETGIEKGALASYDSLILPGVACLSDKTADTIRSYVKEGGSLLGNFDVGMYDGNGVFAGGSKLADVFGMTGEPRITETSWPSVMFKASDHPLLDSMDVKQSIAPRLDAVWTFTDDTETIMVSHPPRTSVYDQMPEERYPSLVGHAYGKGKAYYISGNFGETYADRHPAAYRQIIKGFCDHTARKVVECDDKGLYEVVLRRQEDRFLLHIVNITGSMVRPIEKVSPLYDLRFRLHLKGFGIDKKGYSLSAARGGRLDDIVVDDDQISFALDCLNEYEIIVIDPAE